MIIKSLSMWDLRVRSKKARYVALLFFSVITLQAQTFTSLLNFDGANGADSNAALVQGSDGDFYGVAGGGGPDLAGSVFKVTSKGTLTTVHSFCVTGTS